MAIKGGVRVCLSFPGLFTAIYASPVEEKLWEALLKEADKIDKPWLLAGDFNIQ